MTFYLNKIGSQNNKEEYKVLKPVFKPRLLQPLRTALATGPIKRKIGPKTIRFPFNGFDFNKDLNHFNFLTSKKSAVFRMKKLNKNFVSK